MDAPWLFPVSAGLSATVSLQQHQTQAEQFQAAFLIHPSPAGNRLSPTPPHSAILCHFLMSSKPDQVCRDVRGLLQLHSNRNLSSSNRRRFQQPSSSTSAISVSAPIKARSEQMSEACSGFGGRSEERAFIWRMEVKYGQIYPL